VSVSADGRADLHWAAQRRPHRQRRAPMPFEASRSPLTSARITLHHAQHGFPDHKRACQPYERSDGSGKRFAAVYVLQRGAAETLMHAMRRSSRSFDASATVTGAPHHC